MLQFTGKRIAEFLAFFKEKFPGSSITPKMHMLEDHVLPFLEKWRVGFGLLGEQGAESIHTTFNNLNRVYANIRDEVERLHYITVEHHRKISPLLKATVELEDCE